MKRQSVTQLIMTAAVVAAFLFVLGVTFTSIPQPGRPTFDLASVTKH